MNIDKIHILIINYTNNCNNLLALNELSLNRIYIFKK